MSDDSKSKLRAELHSRIICFLQMDSIDGVYSTYLDRINKQVSLAEVEDIMKKVLYTPGYADKFIKSSDFIRKKARPIDFTKEELYYIYLITKYYGSQANGLLQNQLRTKLLFQHSNQKISQMVEQILKFDANKVGQIISQFAVQIAHEEAGAIGERFNEVQLAEASISKETLKWWHDSFRIPDEMPSAVEVEASKMNDTQIELCERALEFLTPLESVMAVISTMDQDFQMTRKHFLILEEAPPEVDTDLYISKLSDFVPSKNGKYGALIMLKNDSNFYIENVGSETIYVDATEIFPGQVTYARDNMTVEFGEATIVFKINFRFIEYMKQAGFTGQP